MKNYSKVTFFILTSCIPLLYFKTKYIYVGDISIFLCLNCRNNIICLTMSTKETGATFNLMPGSLNSRDDQYAPQLKLLQFLLWKNLHYFTGTEVENPLLSTYAISQLVVSPVIHCDGSPPAPLSISSAADVQPSNSLFEEFVDKGGLAVLSNYLLTHGGLGETAEEMVGILTPSSFSSAKRRRTGHLILGSAVDIQSIPSHTLVAFNIFLGIPLFAKTVLQDQRRATMLVRLALSVSDDEHGSNFQFKIMLFLFKIIILWLFME